MNIKKLNEELKICIKESLEEHIDNLVHMIIEQEVLKEYWTDYELEDIASQLANMYGYSTYNSNGIALVLNVKGRPHIKFSEITSDMQNKINDTIQDLIDNLQNTYKNFIIVGRSGGYWGLSNLIDHIIISEKGRQVLKDYILEIVKGWDFSDPADTEEHIVQVIQNNIYDFSNNLFSELIKEVDNFDIDNQYLSIMNTIENDIKYTEQVLNQEETYQLQEGIVDNKQYNTPYGKFIIITNELKRRKRNIITSKIEMVPVRTVIGYFKDYPKAIEFWVGKDNGSRYLTSSQGDSWNDLAQYLNVDTYNELLDQVYESVLDCFRNYYNDFNIQ